MSRAEYRTIACPDVDGCGWSCQIQWIPDTRIDPGYLKDDPPEECPECGRGMGDAELEPAYEDPFDDGDRAFDMAHEAGEDLPF